jgi:hypothetical protein
MIERQKHDLVRRKIGHGLGGFPAKGFPIAHSNKDLGDLIGTRPIEHSLQSLSLSPGLWQER